MSAAGDELHLLQLVQGGALIRVAAVCSSCRALMLDPAGHAADIAARQRPGSVWKPIEGLALLKPLREHLAGAAWFGCCGEHEDVDGRQVRLLDELTRIAIAARGGLA